MYRLHGFFTQNTLKTLYVLEELGVGFEYHFIDLLQGEHMTDRFREMTPAGKVPVLEHDGEYLFESGAICRYVASVEHSSLYPADKLQRARVDQWMTFFSCHAGRWLTNIYFEQVMKPIAGRGKTDVASCEKAVKLAHQQLRIVDDWLENTMWLANDALSVADPFALAYVEQVRAIDFPLDRYPRVEAWFERLETRDATARARARVESYAKAVLSS